MCKRETHIKYNNNSKNNNNIAPLSIQNEHHNLYSLNAMQ